MITEGGVLPENKELSFLGHYGTTSIVTGCIHYKPCFQPNHLSGFDSFWLSPGFCFTKENSIISDTSWLHSENLNQTWEKIQLILILTSSLSWCKISWIILWDIGQMLRWDVGTKFLVLTNLAKIMVSPSLTDTGVPVFSPPRRPHKEHTPVLRYHQSMKPLVSSDHLCNLGGLSDG